MVVEHGKQTIHNSVVGGPTTYVDREKGLDDGIDQEMELAAQECAHRLPSLRFAASGCGNRSGGG